MRSAALTIACADAGRPVSRAARKPMLDVRHLEILGPAPSKNGRRVLVRCACGKEFPALRRRVTGDTPRLRSCGCMRVALGIAARPRRAPGKIAPAHEPHLTVVHPLIPAQSIHVFDAVLLGRAVIALASGPLTLPDLARACGVPVAELVERQGVLRGHVHALRFGEDVAYLHSHGLTTTWGELEPMRGGAMSEARKAA